MNAQWLAVAWGTLYGSAFARFLFVGGCSTLLQMALLMLAVEQLQMQPVWASAVSYCISATVNYLMNFYLTFTDSSPRHIEAAPKFCLVVLIGATVNTLAFALFLKIIGMYLIAQILAIVIAVVSNYLLHKFWIYRK